MSAGSCWLLRAFYLNADERDRFIDVMKRPIELRAMPGIASRSYFTLRYLSLLLGGLRLGDCTDILEKILSFFGGKIQAIGGKIDAVARPSWWPFDWGKHIPQGRRPKSPQASSMRGASRRFKISHECPSRDAPAPKASGWVSA